MSEFNVMQPREVLAMVFLDSDGEAPERPSCLFYGDHVEKLPDHLKTEVIYQLVELIREAVPWCGPWESTHPNAMRSDYEEFDRAAREMGVETTMSRAEKLFRESFLDLSAEPDSFDASELIGKVAVLAEVLGIEGPKSWTRHGLEEWKQLPKVSRLLQ